jgi:asparagine synthase (glutamine-hydrolysing)
MKSNRSTLLIEIEKKTSICHVISGSKEVTDDGSVILCQPASSADPKPSAQQLLDLYRQKGLDFPNYLKDDCFVFIWLPEQSTYVLVNDKLGLLPVFYYEDDKRLIISDHVSGILSRGIDAQLNPRALMDYFSFFWVLGEETFFKGIFRFPTAHIQENQQRKCYWIFEQTRSIKDKILAARQVSEAVEAAVQKHLIRVTGDIATHLSGGVDSSVINLLIHRHWQTPIHTYAMRLAEGKNESRWIEEVRQQIDAKHTWVEPGYPTIFSVLDEVIQVIGEPMGYPSVISRYLLEQQIQQRDVFNGRGVDELFSGYTWHLPPHLDHHMERRQVLAKDAIFEMIPDLKFMALDYNPNQAYMDIYNRNQAGSGLERSMSFDIQVLLRYWLEIEYHVSTAFKHRCHMPVLDAEVVSLAATIGYSLKASHSETKIIFKTAFSDLLPASILKRPKMGLNMPFSALLNSATGEVVQAMIQTLSSREFPELDLAVILEKLQQHRSGTINWGWQFWGILSYILWKKHYMV